MKSYSMCLLFILVMTWGRKWWLGTRVQPNWTLSTPASTNRTLRDAALFTSSWLPRVFGELVILRHREKGSQQAAGNGPCPQHGGASPGPPHRQAQFRVSHGPAVGWRSEPSSRAAFEVLIVFFGLRFEFGFDADLRTSPSQLLGP